MAAGLACFADREGRLKDSILQIKIDMFPADNIDVDELLDELDSAGFITRYLIGGCRYIEITNFKKHQYIYSTEPKSVIPKWSSRHLSVTGPSPEGDEIVIETKTKTKTKTERQVSCHPGFDDWWQVWPLKVGKIMARRAWDKKKPDAEVVIADTLERIENHKPWQPDWRGESFIPNPATYINQERHTDALIPTKAAADVFIPKKMIPPTPARVAELKAKFDPGIVDTVVGGLVMAGQHFTDAALVGQIKAMSH